MTPLNIIESPADAHAALASSTAAAGDSRASALRGDFAMMQLGPQGMVTGSGPFESLPEPPKSGVAFYVNDFVLSDPRPWKVPAEWRYFPEWEECPKESDPQAAPVLRWNPLEPALFQEVFGEIMAALEGGELKKAVPVVTERAVLESGSMAGLLARTERQERAWLYGFQDGEFGFAGRTPERLFTVRNQVLRTMALAGTAPPEAAADFEKDPKEIAEHRMVVQDLLSVMGCFGEVKVSPRQQLDVGGMLHFLTNFEVDLGKETALDLNRVLRAFHPTPAVGVLPRSAEANQLLRSWRSRLETPAYFGAPFGVKMDDTFHAVVGIRNVTWEGPQVFLPSGCGILQGSVAEKEWRELELKREWVKRAFGLKRE